VPGGMIRSNSPARLGIVSVSLLKAIRTPC
jgi:hypothetical protein